MGKLADNALASLPIRIQEVLESQCKGTVTMIATKDRLKSLRVSDAMAHHVVTVTANSTMGEAADVLCMHKITGAPVIDECGKYVGVLSGTDFIHSTAEGACNNQMSHTLVKTGPQTPYCIEEVGLDLVRKHMNPTVKTIGVEIPLIQAAHSMCNEHIHRLIVVDDHFKPVGILTSLDLVATLIGVMDE
jgi:predicted transcriptional regulator